MRGRREPDATVFLVGFMGAGKTAVGKALASARSWGFEDTDAAVEIALGRAIPEIFNELGEGAFREAESAALRMVAGRPRTVVATGGGLFLSLAHRAVVRAGGVSVWLDASLEVAAARLEGAAGRPLWPREDTLARRALYERRRAAYALADLRVDADPAGPENVARAVHDSLRALCR
ncbi:MAG TPA: shikimate kinase [Candidatus Sulfotelmatobacter sp.]|jgi:shikimate kinase|nr:shikimate kinase [Candidatus Sulfotelmatobacter sp.]